MKTERRESLENNNVTAEPMPLWRRPPSCREVSNTRTGGEHRGSGDGMSAKDQEVNTGKPDAAGSKIPTRGRGRTDWAESGGGKVRTSDETSNDQHPLAHPFHY
jgi:hypothetical protein